MEMPCGYTYYFFPISWLTMENCKPWFPLVHSKLRLNYLYHYWIICIIPLLNGCFQIISQPEHWKDIFLYRMDWLFKSTLAQWTHFYIIWIATRFYRQKWEARVRTVSGLWVYWWHQMLLASWGWLSRTIIQTSLTIKTENNWLPFSSG